MAEIKTGGLVGEIGLKCPACVGVLPAHVGLVGGLAYADALLGDIAGKSSAFGFALGSEAVTI